MKLCVPVLLVLLASAPVSAQEADPAGDAPAAAPQGTTDRIFGVMPNFATVENGSAVPPISARQKFTLASLNTFDPFVYPFVGIMALTSHSYGSGTLGFVKQYGASLTDNVTGNFMTSAVMPSLLHQDPRYFERGSGGVLHRLAYAASRTAITRGDSGARQVNVSEIGGTAIAAGLSNLYYPAGKRAASATLLRCGMQVTWDSLANELKEFWPDIHRHLRHGTTPGVS